MKSKKKIIQPLQTCIYIILILLAVVYIAPMLWVLLVSLKTNAEVMGSPFSLPSINAASISSDGIPLKKFVRRNTAVGRENVIYGSSRPVREFVKPSLENLTNKGISTQ